MHEFAKDRTGLWAWLAVGMVATSVAVAAEPSVPAAVSVGAPAMPPSTPVQVGGQPFFPIGVYRYPKHDPSADVYKSLAEAGFNFYLLPSSATKQELDAAHANGIKVMLVVADLMNLSGTPEQIAAKKKTLATHIGPESPAFKHPAVVALEGPDEPLWNAKHPVGPDGISPEMATWVRPAEQQQRVYALLKGLRDGYQEIHRLCGDRYRVFINFAPRGDEDEFRWFTELPVVGGYQQDGRTTADAFGTDIYPIPNGGGNNGWIRGWFVPSAATVGAYTEKLRRAVHPHPFYMVLHGCGIAEWDPKAVQAGTSQRRPTFTEQQFMTFDAIVHGAGGVLIWGADYIDDASLYWRQIGRIHRPLRALAPMLAEGTPWPEARSGMQQITVLGKLHQGERYVVATNNEPAGPLSNWVAVPGWKGQQAYSLLDGREVPVVNEVIHDTIPPLSARVYTDGTSLFKALGWPAPAVLAKRPMRTLFSLPTDVDPFKGKSPQEIPELLRGAGVDGVVSVHDPKLVDALHQVGIKAYAEIGCFAGKGAWKKFPGTQPITASGEPFDPASGYGGSCLNQEAYVLDLLSRIDHLLREANWDGLWLDYIRWPGKWEEKEPTLIPVCFCDTCLARFSADRGVHYPKDMTATKDRAAWILKNHAEEWTAWKCDRVTDVVARIRQRVKAQLGADALLGIFGVPMRQGDFDGAILRTFGQDWAKLGPYVDVFSPMVYHLYCHRPREWISQVTNEVAQLSGRTVWPIVQSGSEPVAMSVGEFDQTLREGLKPPSSGIMIFNTSATIKEGKWETMAKVYKEVGNGK